MRRSGIMRCSVMWMTWCVLCLGMVGCTARQKEEYRIHTNIIFYGDNITTGFGVNEDQSYVYRISEIVKSQVYGMVFTYNSGANDQDSVDALRRYKRDVIDLDPDIVIISFGLIDSQDAAMTPAVFRKTILTMVDSLPPTARPVIATSHPFLPDGGADPRLSSDRFNALMNVLRDIAQKRDIMLIDIQRIWEREMKLDPEGVKSYYFDTIYPSPKGHYIYYSAYMAALRRLLR